MLSGEPIAISTSIVNTQPIESRIQSAVLDNGITLFVGETEAYGEELMKLDADGNATLVRDISPGGVGAGIQNWTVFEDRVFFQSRRQYLDGSWYSTAWSSDGTDSGTYGINVTRVLGANDFNRIGDQLYISGPGEVYYGDLTGRTIFRSLGARKVLGSVGDLAILQGNEPNNRSTLMVHHGSDRSATLLTPTIWTRLDVIGDVNGKLLLRGVSEANGDELWVTDGTVDGTQMLEINPGASGADLDHNGFVRIGDAYVFAANDGLAGGELWRTDGTRDGTYMLRDIQPGPVGSNPGAPSRNNTSRGSIKALGEQVLFIADDGIHGIELWRTDGTQAGTQIVKDINAGTGSSQGSGGYFVHEDIPGVAILNATNGTVGDPLPIWITDGAESGTFSIKDILPTDGSILRVNFDFEPFQGKWYFPALIDQFGWELWSSDGTRAGTGPVVETRNEYMRYPPRILTSIGDSLIYNSDNRRENRSEVWKTDGTPEGTQLLLAEPHPETSNGLTFSHTIRAADQVYLSSIDGGTWVMDGTPEGSEKVQLEIAETLSTSFANLVPVGDTLLFNNYSTALGNSLWRVEPDSDEIAYDSSAMPGSIFGFNDELYSVLNWTYDSPQTASIYQRGDQEPIELLSLPLIYDQAILDGELFMIGESPDRADDAVLWRLADDLSAATIVATMPGGSTAIRMPKFVGSASGKLYFNVDNSVTSQLWVTDGTVGGTTKLTDDGNMFAGVLGSLGGQLLFGSRDATIGNELWTTDGTVAGTRLLKDINFNSGSSNPLYGVRQGNQLYFTANDGRNGSELWRTDGTAAGTRQVVDLQEGGDSDPISLGLAGDKLIFLAGKEEKELWATDGSEAGTAKIWGGTFNVTSAESMNGKLYFINQGTVYVTDGTVLGREVLQLGFGSVSQLTRTENNLYVKKGAKIWRIDSEVPIQLQPPSINSLTVSPTTSVTLGDSVTLTANNVADADGVVAELDFYRDSNGDGTLDSSVDAFLGNGSQTGQDWLATVATDGWSLGENRVFAVGTDDDDLRSNVAVSLVTIVEQETTSDQNVLAISTTNQVGSFNGTLDDLSANDNVYQSVTEQPIGSSFALQQVWNFDLPTGNRATFSMEAHHDGTDDAYWVNYSTDGRNWQNMLTISKSADDGMLQTYNLPEDISGPFWVKVRDTNRGQDDAQPSSVFVDQMFVKVVGSDPGTGQTTVFADAQVTRLGTVVDNDLAALRSRDGSRQILDETASPGSRLIHEWSFDVPADAETATVVLNAYQNAAQGEVFWLNYSVDGIFWKNLTTISNQDPNALASRVMLPDAVRGSVRLKVLDSVRNDDSSQDRLAIDQLFIEIANVDEEPGDPQQPEPPFYGAESEQTRIGSVAGNLRDTYATDSVFERITETGANAALEHQWKFNVPSGGNAIFHLTARHNSVDEVVWFNFSTDGRNWRNMLTVAPGSGSTQSYRLPSGINGDVFVKTRDSNRSGDSELNTLEVDRLAIEVE